MIDTDEELKTFSIRLPRSLWLWLKKDSADQEKPMGDLVWEAVASFKKKKTKSHDEKNI